VAEELRHPMFGPHEFVAFDVRMDDQSRYFLLTGPNMAGKSTFLRTLCLTIVMAQVGLPVCAKKCKLPCFSRVVSRMGSKDNILQGQSTFYSELKDVQAIFEPLDGLQFCALDEVGRGTASQDGKAIAFALLKHLKDRQDTMGVITTHYLDIPLRFDSKPFLTKNMGFNLEGNDKLSFTYRLTEGVASASFAINVCRVARVPEEIIQRARDYQRQWQSLTDERSTVNINP
jgi:DNA mismatch repair ATPase MutS